MVLADVLGTRSWELIGSDISTRVLEQARSGHYPIELTDVGGRKDGQLSLLAEVA